MENILGQNRSREEFVGPTRWSCFCSKDNYIISKLYCLPKTVKDMYIGKHARYGESICTVYKTDYSWPNKPIDKGHKQ